MSKLYLAIFSFYAHLIAGTLTVNVNTDSNVDNGGTFTQSGAGTGSGDLRGCLNYINTFGTSTSTFDIVFSNPGTITLGSMLPVINLFGLIQLQ
jgi:hypothetical protein